MSHVEKSYLLCGVGGQGTVLASKLLAFAAMEQGLSVRTAETMGMAQRGGCVVSHVRIGDEIASPLIPKGGADVILGFEPAEAVRCLPYLKHGGAAVVCKKAITPVTASLNWALEPSSPIHCNTTKPERNTADTMLAYLHEHIRRLTVMDGEAICRICGSPKVLNIALLATAAGTGYIDLTPEALKEAIRKRIPEQFHALNLQAVEAALSALRAG